MLRFSDELTLLFVEICKVDPCIYLHILLSEVFELLNVI